MTGSLGTSWSRHWWPRTSGLLTAAGLTHRARGRVATAAALLLVGVLASWNLTTAPSTWYDEGMNLQAARNLARAEGYGLVYSADVVPFGQLTTGPTVIVPVALVFHVFGVGLAQGRAVMVAYSLLAALGLYRAGGLLYGTGVAGLAVLVRCATDLGGPATSRDVVGEVAALAYLFWGLALFVSARRTGRPTLFVAAGLLFGFAIVTKAQFGLVLPALVGAWLLTRGQQGGVRVRDIALAVAAATAPVAGWQLYQWASLGTAGYLAHLHEQSATLSVSAYVPPLSRAADGVLVLLASTFTWLGLAGLAYVWLMVLRRGWRNEHAEHLVLPIFAALWLVWYLGLSEAYSRYAIPLAATCSLFSARLGRDLIVGWSRSISASPAGRALTVGLALVLAAPVGLGIGLQVVALGRATDTSAQEIAAVLLREVGPNVSTESWEWQLDVLAERPFHHPPPFVPAVPYAMPAAAYLVDGPMSKAFELYRQELAHQSYHLVASAGPYDLYRRAPAPAP